MELECKEDTAFESELIKTSCEPRGEREETGQESAWRPRGQAWDGPRGTQGTGARGLWVSSHGMELANSGREVAGMGVRAAYGAVVVLVGAPQPLKPAKAKASSPLPLGHCRGGWSWLSSGREGLELVQGREDCLQCGNWGAGGHGSQPRSETAAGASTEIGLQAGCSPWARAPKLLLVRCTKHEMPTCTSAMLHLSTPLSTNLWLKYIPSPAQFRDRFPRLAVAMGAKAGSVEELMDEEMVVLGKEELKVSWQLQGHLGAIHMFRELSWHLQVEDCELCDLCYILDSSAGWHRCHATYQWQLFGTHGPQVVHEDMGSHWQTLVELESCQEGKVYHLVISGALFVALGVWGTLTPGWHPSSSYPCADPTTWTEDTVSLH
ncbi:Coiled-coil domain-containing protein 85B [Galemys pyrenaicus]|uniref:Coiled-coil domain-containing protein 85B n=1 Tax=Galemys pyrenaicus TaxID=202257 RepID=A0A8J5ZX48_GALPY|nr:Coiled-coil domain-containing protein 85B [Galemys pyrenaicus]